MTRDLSLCLTKCRTAIAVLLISTAWSGLAFSQSITGSVTGAVSDPQGAAVVGVGMTITNAVAGINQTTVSDSAGNFQFRLLPPGTYVLEAKVPGFNTFRRQGILVEADRSQAIPVDLSIGEVAQTVEVKAGTVLLEANSSTVGTVMDTQKIQDLPLNGRNPEALSNLIPSVRGLNRFGGPVTKTFSTGLVVIGGGSPISNGFLLDGVPNDKAGQAPGAMTHLAADATQEFKVLTNSFSAEYGRSGGGVISVISKSGTNEFHGVASNYLRNTVFNANTFFGNIAGQPRPVLKINQWTGVLGGPIKKDKLFFFFNYEGYAERRDFNRIISAPTTLQRGGDFSQTRAANGSLITIYDPLTTVANPNVAGAYVRTPFVNNLVPVARFTKVAQGILALYPQPNLPGVAVTNINNLGQTGSQPTDRTALGMKVDYNLSATRRLAVRYTYDVVDWTYANYWNSVLETEGRHNHIPRNSASLQYTEGLSPSLLLDVKLGYNRDNEVAWCPFDEPQYGGNIDFISAGYPASFAATVHRDKLSTRGKWPQHVISDTATVAGCNSNFRAGSALAGSAAITKITGNHTLKAGYQLVQYMDNTGGGGFAGTIFRYDRGFTQGPNPNAASATAGFGTASFLLGYTSATQTSVSPFQAQQAMVQRYHSLFFQDDWKVTSKLTLNLGLRWEFEAPITDRFNQFTNWDPGLTSPLQVPGLSLKGGATFADPSGGAHQSFTNSIYNHYAPRFGYAYQATRKIVARGGYGISWIPTKGTPIYQNAGFRVANAMASSIDGGLKPFNTMADPYPGGVQGPTGSSRGALTEVGSDFYGLLRNIRPGYAQQWNQTVQWQPWSNWLFEVAYLGNRGLRLLTMQSINYNQLAPQYLALGNQLNQPVTNPFFGTILTGPLSGPTVARQQLLRPYPQYNNVFGNYDFLGDSIYHALTLKVEKRLGQGLSLLVAYTKSKLIDAASYNAGVLNWYNLRAERSRGAQDIPQRLVITGLWQIPFAQQKRGWQRQVLQGWHLNTIATMQSGGTLSPSAGGISGRPNVVAGVNPKVEEQTLARWFNTGAYSVPGAFEYGNSSRTIPNVSGPGIMAVDGSIFKDFSFTERYKLQLRGEAFNVLNTPNFANPGTGVGTQNFGVVTANGAVLPREMQVSLRFTF